MTLPSNTSLFDSKVAAYTARLQKDVGIKGFQADGIWGNIGHECNGFHSFQEQDPTSGRGGYGWMQWTGPRRVAFENYCRDKNLDPDSDEANYDFLVRELLTSEKDSLDRLKRANTRDTATYAFMHWNERPGIEALESRFAWAKRAETVRLREEAKLLSEVAKIPPAEGKPKMTDTTSVQPAPPLPQVKPDAESIADAIARIEARLEDLAMSQLQSHGVPAVAVQLLGLVLKQVDFAAMVQHIDWGALAERLVERLATYLNAKKPAA
jgi:hypothetical protein